MRNLVVFLCLVFSIFDLYGQLPLSFSSSGWKFYANTVSPQIPPDYGAFDWKSPGYNTVETGWPSNPPYLQPQNSTPFGYPGSSYTNTTFSNIYPTSPLYTGSKLITSYFRKTVTDPNLQSYTSLTLNVKRDDGVIVYLNGIEVYRDNIQAGDVSEDTPATTFVGAGSSHDVDQNIPAPITISGVLLTSVLSAYSTDLTKLTVTAEIHQSLNPGDVAPYSSSSDCFFDLELTGATGPITPIITRGPYLQLPHPTGIQIRWKTNTHEMGKVCYSNIGPITPSNPGTPVPETIATKDHIVNLTGLSQNTTYFYSIQNTTNTIFVGDANHKFTTPPSGVNNSLTTRIWVTGDHQDDYKPDVQDQVKSGFINFYNSQNSPQIDLWLLLGDLGDSLGREFEYDAYFFNYYNDGNFKVMQQTPILPSLGNHDYYNGVSIKSTFPQTKIDSLESNNKISPISPSNPFGLPSTVFGSLISESNFRISRDNPFFNLFSFPTSGLNKYSTTNNSSKKGYYSYNHNNIHFISLDSYGFYNNYLLFGDTTSSNNNPQFKWLIEDLNATKNNPDIKWTIMFWHHSPYTNAGGHNSDLEVADEFILRGIREKLIKFLDNANYKIDLVLNGHSHAYQRSKLLKGHYGFSSTFDPSLHNNPLLNTNFNSNANSDGKFGAISQCPYFKSQSNTKNEGIVYIVTGSSSQIQRRSKAPGNSDFTTGHSALNGSYFRPPFTRSLINSDGTFMVTETVSSNVEDTYGGSFLIEVKGNRLDGKFVNQLGSVTDEFTIMKDVNKGDTLEKIITQIDFPDQSPQLQKIASPWPKVQNFILNGPGITNQTFANEPVSINNPQIGPIYIVKDQTTCLTQNIRFHFSPDCWTNGVTINNLIDSPEDEKINSSTFINANNTIKYNATFNKKVYYNAATAINLNPNTFKVENGAVFNARIIPCNKNN
jgi:hypothetical protein